MRLRVTVCVGAICAAAAFGGCGSSSGGSKQSTQLLQQAKTTIDATNALHFTLATSGDHGSTAITSGEGDLQRPDKLKATFKVAVDGIPASVAVASSGSTFLAKLPFSSGYMPTDPSSFGIANPAKLVSPNGGLSSILVEMNDPKSSGETRVNGEVLQTITGSVPGSDITALPDQDPSKPVQVVAKINPSSHQLRQVSLTGPIGTSGQATFTLTLTDYGENVDLALPPVG